METELAFQNAEASTGMTPSKSEVSACHQPNHIFFRTMRHFDNTKCSESEQQIQSASPDLRELVGETNWL